MATSLPIATLRDIVRNPSAQDEARQDAAYELYLAAGPQAFASEDMHAALREVREAILNSDVRQHVLGPAALLDLIQHCHSKTTAVEQATVKTNNSLADSLDARHTDLAARLEVISSFVTGLERAIQENQRSLEEGMASVRNAHADLQAGQEQSALQQREVNASIVDRLDRLEAEPRRAQGERDELGERLASLERNWVIRLANWIWRQ